MQPINFFEKFVRLKFIIYNKILFDDRDIKEFNLSWWRSQLSIVSQEAVLFNMSFRDNIRLGDVNATDAEVEEAAKAGIFF